MAYEEFFNLLKQEHNKVKDDLNRIPKASTTSERLTLWEQFKKDIIPHMKGEEKYFYGAMVQLPECKAVADRANLEHRMAANVMNEMEQMLKIEGWSKDFSAFKDSINSHISFEEGEVWSKARRCFSEAKLREILNSYKQEEQNVLATMTA